MNKYLRLSSLLVVMLCCSLLFSCKKDKDKDKDNPVTPIDPIEYVVVYDTTFGSFKDGSTYLEQKYEAGKSVNLITEEPTREGYEFAGWINQETQKPVVSSFTIQKNVVLEANWVVKKLKVFTIKS